ncbi:MAG: sugar phosphate isomerase/epimerase family protein [Limnochordia bacterium]
MAIKTGIQLYSVRKSLARDPYGTLAKVAEIGYRYVEAANHNAAADPGVGFGVPAREMRKTLDDLGLKLVGCHVAPLELEIIDQVLDYHQEVGNPQIGCAIDFFPYGDVDFIMRRCELFNQLGEKCKGRGMRFYYHNHYQEFQKFGDNYVYDIIMENTDPSLVFIEIDTYWVTRAGLDPIAVMEKYRDRLVLLHQKDFPNDAPQRLVMFDGVINPQANINMDVFGATIYPECFTEIGTGTLPIQETINAAARAPHLEYILLEQDHSKLEELDSISVSMEAFRKFSGIEWD